MINNWPGVGCSFEGEYLRRGTEDVYFPRGVESGRCGLVDRVWLVGKSSRARSVVVVVAVVVQLAVAMAPAFQGGILVSIMTTFSNLSVVVT